VVAIVSVDAIVSPSQASRRVLPSLAREPVRYTPSVPDRSVLESLAYVNWTLLFSLALGAAASLLMAPSSPGVADAVERRGVGDYGAGFSILNIAYALGMMAGPYLGSALAQEFGLRTALIAAGLAIGAYAFVVRRADERERGAAPAPETEAAP